MIRRVELQDAKAITTIYNEYVEHSVPELPSAFPILCMRKKGK